MINKKINKNDVKRSEKLKKDTYERIMSRVGISHGISDSQPAFPKLRPE